MAHVGVGVNFNFYRAITNPRVLGVIFGFALVILGLANAGGSALVNAVLGLAGLAIMFASVAPRAFEHLLRWITREISNALIR